MSGLREKVLQTLNPKPLHSFRASALPGSTGARAVGCFVCLEARFAYLDEEV